MSGRMGLYQCIVLVIILLCTTFPAHADTGPLVAAASSLRSLWPALTRTYTSQTAQSISRVSFGSSGLLSTQILNGAPFEIFLSADLASVKRLPKHFLKESPEVYATGELCLVVPASSPLAETLSLRTLAAALAQNTNVQGLRVAIPNPIHAPYGKAAKAALQSAGIWPLPPGRLLSAENAAQTLQFVKSGAVAAAIVPRALLSTNNKGIVSVALPPDSYQAVEHYVAVLHVAESSAQRFARWLLSDDARQILEESGLRVAVR